MVSLTELAKKKAAAPAVVKPAPVPVTPPKTSDPKPAVTGGVGLGALANALGVKPVERSPKQVDSLDALAGIDLATVESSRKESNDDGAQEVLQGLVPIDSPVRELDKVVTQEQKAFVNMLDSVYTLHHDPEAVRTAITRIMMDMRETPHLASLVMPNDVAVIIRTMKSIMGFRKAKAETKKKASSGRRQTKKAAFTDALGSELDSLLSL